MLYTPATLQKLCSPILMPRSYSKRICAGSLLLLPLTVPCTATILYKMPKTGRRSTYTVCAKQVT